MNYSDFYATKKTIDTDSGQADSKPSKEPIDFEVDDNESNADIDINDVDINDIDEDNNEEDILLYDNDDERQSRIDILGEDFVNADDERMKRLLKGTTKKVTSKDFLSKAGFELLDIANSAEFKKFADKKVIGDKSLSELTNQIIKKNDVTKIKFLTEAVNSFKNLKEKRPVSISASSLSTSVNTFSDKKLSQLEKAVRKYRVGSAEQKNAYKEYSDYLKQKG